MAMPNSLPLFNVETESDMLKRYDITSPYMLVLQLLYVPIVWKQWLLPIETAHFEYWCHNHRADPGMSAGSTEVPGSAIPLWYQNTKWSVPVWNNHCLQAIETYREFSWHSTISQVNVILPMTYIAGSVFVNWTSCTSTNTIYILVTLRRILRKIYTLGKSK